MGKVDVTLRDIIRDQGRGFLRELGIEGRVTLVPASFPSTRERQVDFLGLAEGAGGKKVLAHVEFQSQSDPEMVQRMLEYYSTISRWCYRQNRMGSQPSLPDEVVQIVVYSGNGRWNAPTSIHRRGIHFEFELVDIRMLSSRKLLASGDSGDTLIALLCAGGCDRDVIKAIVKKISQAPKNQQSDLGVQLLALAQVRGVRALIEREIMAMPITVNIDDIPLLREPFERAQAKSREDGLAEGLAEGLARGEAKGEAKGRATAIERLLKRKFPSDVPAGLAEYLAKLPLQSLDEILDDCLTAKSVSDALGRHAPKG